MSVIGFFFFGPCSCKITVNELARRVGPPEYMSFSSLVAYLRADNNTRKELQAQLEEAGIKPSDLTTEKIGRAHV